MTNFSEHLSAYLDGELDGIAVKAVETRLATDPAAQAKLDALIEADALAQDVFDETLNDPVPFALAQQIKSASLPEHPTAKSRPIWNVLAASLVMFSVGGIAGYALKIQTAPVQTAGWLADIADYHALYASQTRYLVEVSADKSNHLKTWLGNTIGTSFSIPDMSEYGLTFEGGRLLVANGKPVAQLMYRDPNGAVVALCLQRSNGTSNDSATFKQQTINGFDFVSWSAEGADYVVIGPNGQPDLNEIAATAAMDV